MQKIFIANIEPQYFAGLEALQAACFPNLGPDERMCVHHFAKQYEVFREGQFVAVYHSANGEEQVIGQGSGFFIDFDFEHPDHTFFEICGQLYFTNHDPNGAYYYGADISVHPDFRRRSVGKRLYKARQDLVRRCNRQGIVAGGMIPGYAKRKGQMNAREYIERVVAGEFYDRTLTFQLKNGFHVRGVLENYIDHPPTDNWSTLIEWVNPDYRP
ncbi:MAG: GNAT family N-acetyltransferase [Caldilineaceae bacterium]|nr:GNAT family N-acetyltransferase [Caldilineaceae bacterium]